MKTASCLIICMLYLGFVHSYSQTNQQVTIQQEAHFPGGDHALIKYLYENMHWPEDIKGNVIDDQCMISFNIRADSMVENIVLLKKDGYGIDQQISELLKRKKFVPSIQNNIPVKMNIMLTIPTQYRKK